MEKRYSELPFGVRLKELLTATGDTGESRKLSEFLDVSQVAIRQWTNNNNLPTVDKMLKVAEYFDVSVDWLMGARSDARTPDVAVQAIVERYGLREGALKQLEEYATEIRENEQYYRDINEDGAEYQGSTLDVEYEAEFGEPGQLESAPKLALLAVNALLENERGRNALTHLGAAISGGLDELYADTALFRATKELALLQEQLLKRGEEK
jgi:transcriptional regulator with XRE-family HTH domain